MNFGKVYLGAAVGIWLFGNLILCECPEVFFVSSVFASVAILKNAGRLRSWSWIVLVAALVLTAFHLIRKFA